MPKSMLVARLAWRMLLATAGLVPCGGGRGLLGAVIARKR
jgi:hypothetical protein